jgi:hypothetical protein
MTPLRVLLFLVFLAALAGRASAQGREPIGLFVADVRVALPGYKQDPNVAAALRVDTLDLPSRGLGLVFGGHIYPLRRGVITFGLGAELMTSGRSRSPEEATAAGTTDSTVHTGFSSFAPQVSFNFGSRQGWSYISGGLGWGRFTTELTATPLPDAENRLQTINYGGGARWFVNGHVAVSLDLRFYAINPQEATLTRPAYPRATIVTFSAGVGFK